MQYYFYANLLIEFSWSAATTTALIHPTAGRVIEWMRWIASLDYMRHDCIENESIHAHAVPL